MHRRSSLPIVEKPVKVLITVPWGERLGGAENFLLTILQHIDRDSVAPTVVFLQGGGFEGEVACLGVPTVVIPASRLRQIRESVHTVGALARLLRREQPDLLLNWVPKTQLYGAPAAVLAGVGGRRVIWWQHGIPKHNWMDRVATLLPARAVGCSSEVAARAQRSLRPARSTFVVHPGIEVHALPASRDRARLRAKLGIPIDRIVIGNVGRLQPLKGQDRLLRVVAALRARHQPVHCLIVGGDAYGLSPQYASRLLRLAEELHLTDAVTFTGQVTDPRPFLTAMDVFVMASVGDSFGIVVLEAWDAGLPVVAFDSGGPSEIIESGRTGLLVEPDDGALERVLASLVTDPNVRDELGAGGRRRLCETFTCSSMARRFEEALLAATCTSSSHEA
jgi:glycosyltransferase involved in cell wall biosynthesis